MACATGVAWLFAHALCLINFALLSEVWPPGHAGAAQLRKASNSLREELCNRRRYRPYQIMRSAPLSRDPRVALSPSHPFQCPGWLAGQGRQAPSAVPDGGDHLDVGAPPMAGSRLCPLDEEPFSWQSDRSFLSVNSEEKIVLAPLERANAVCLPTILRRAYLWQPPRFCLA